MKVDFARLDRAFKPKVVVVVGDKKEGNYRWLCGQQSCTGKLYSVQIDPTEIVGIKALGIENCPSVMDIPEPVDLVIVAVPRAVAPRVFEDCIKKQVGAVHFFTAGFSETDTDEGRRLEGIIKRRAEETGMHVIGPNCMGIFSPGYGIRQYPEQYTDVTGPLGFISQSGTHAGTFSQEAHYQGIHVNKSVSFGNGTILESTDFLEYFGQDPEIKAIGMYLEGVKDGKRFLKTLKAVAAKKPVVIWKGGRTEEGGRAIASHTGSLAVPLAIWEAAAKQCGAITVRRLEELIDTLKALLYLKPVRGERVGVTGGSGGQSVAIADVFAEAGLKLPLLTKESNDQFVTLLTLIGGSYRNPIDTGNANRREMKRILEILEQDKNVDNLVLLTTTRLTAAELDNYIDSVVEINKLTPKPVMAILSCNFSPNDVEMASKTMRRLQDGNVPAFVALERGAKALKNTLDYYRFRNGEG